jgi:hypothetical protein
MVLFMSAGELGVYIFRGFLLLLFAYKPRLQHCANLVVERKMRPGTDILSYGNTVENALLTDPVAVRSRPRKPWG